MYVLTLETAERQRKYVVTLSFVERQNTSMCFDTRNVAASKLNCFLTLCNQEQGSEMKTDDTLMIWHAGIAMRCHAIAMPL